ncbi:MAG: putative metal-dependent hydrolase [Luteibaculaceae bacterium]|jgi:predicted metal-dependent hydrolase
MDGLFGRLKRVKKEQAGVIETVQGNLSFYVQPKAKRVILKKKNGQWILVVPKHLTAQKAWSLIQSKIPASYQFGIEELVEPELMPQLDFPNGYSIYNPSLGVEKGDRIAVLDTADEDAIKNQIKKWAKRDLEGYIREEAERVNLPFNKLSFRLQSTRWGSCSFQNNLSINALALFLAPPLLEYLISHELCHTIHKNHGPHFWRKLSGICPNAIQKDRDLRKQQPYWKGFLVDNKKPTLQ